MSLVVRSPDELLAAVPHVLGFVPEESLVVMPLGRGLPVTRVDLPTTAAAREGVWDALSGPYGFHATAGSRVAIICFGMDRDAAEVAGNHLAGRLDLLGIATQLRLWTDGQRWCEFDTGQSGLRTPQSEARVAAAAVFEGAPRPVASREALAASLEGDWEPIAALLPGAHRAGDMTDPGTEREWALARLKRFHADGVRLSDVDGARLLVELKTTGTRDAMWMDMSRKNSISHTALWTDLTRRAPEEVRGAPAGLLGFASWLGGDGARAWCALDQVPAGQSCSMTDVVASALQNGVHPDEWEQHRSQTRRLANELDESFVPEPPSPRRDQHGTRTLRDHPGLGR